MKRMAETLPDSPRDHYQHPPHPPRLIIEERETRELGPWAVQSAQSRGRVDATEACPVRTEFQRDRDRILHSKAFRRLIHKTQVFIAPGDDHDRTRLTHTLEVSQISRTVARALRLNEDLTEAIALGHDLGHPPFGHAGEEALSQLFSCGFVHTDQSYRIVTVLEPLNLSAETLEGIIDQGKDAAPRSLEAQVVKIADRMAYLHHDVEDAIRAGWITEGDLPTEITQVLGTTRGVRLNTMVLDLIQTSTENLHGGRFVIGCSPTVWRAVMALRAWMFQNVYHAASQLENRSRVKRLLMALRDYFMDHPHTIPDSVPTQGESPAAVERRVLDYLSGMTDRYAMYVFQQVLIPQPHHLPLTRSFSVGP